MPEDLKLEEDINKIVEESSNRLLKGLSKQMASPNNPIFRANVKGTPLENITPDGLDKMGTLFAKVYHNRYNAFREGWINVFGGTDVKPFKHETKQYLEEFMEYAMKDGPKASRENYAEDWLKIRLMKERKGIK